MRETPRPRFVTYDQHQGAGKAIRPLTAGSSASPMKRAVGESVLQRYGRA